MLAPSEQPNGSSTTPEAPPTPQISPTPNEQEQGQGDQIRVEKISEQVLGEEEEGDGAGVVGEEDIENKCTTTDNVEDTKVAETIVVDGGNLESEVKEKEKVIEVQVNPDESEEDEEDKESVKQDVVEGVKENDVEIQVEQEEDEHPGPSEEQKDSLGEKESMDPLIDFGDKKEDKDECDDDVVEEKKDEVVGAKFVDFVMEPEPSESEDGKEAENKLGEEGKGDGEVEAEDDTQMILMTGNPELQKIRAEQVRKWLIFEQDSAAAALSVGSSLSESMEADSLAAPVAVSGDRGDGNGSEEGDEMLALSNGEGDQGNPRRVRFLTDQEGNLLISVFMTNTPGVTTPLSEETSLPGNETGEESAREEIASSSALQSPSLVVSPPSLEHVGGNGEEGEELVDSIEPSAPPMEEETTPHSEGEEGDDDEEEPPSIVLVVNPPKEPPREKPPAIPTGQNEDNDSSDDTLSVSSCNSMIEILPHNEADEKINLASGTLDDNNNIENDNENGAKGTSSLDSSGPVALAPCFQLGDSTTAVTTEDVAKICEEDNSSSPQPASLIIHELEEHSEGMAAQNGSSNIPVSKVPDVDENNNIVEDSVLEEGDLDDEEEEPMPEPEPDTQVPQFNPEIGEQVKMPDLRRSTSSSDDGEAEDETVVRRGSGANEHLMQMQMMNGNEDDNHEQQMVSLCIQEEHISAVALTIAKWESMSKAQSTENISVSPSIPPNGPGHAPVTKSSSSPCPKACSPQQLHRLLSSPGSTPSGNIKPIQPVAPLHQTRDPGSKPVVPPIPPAKPQANRVVIHGSHSNPIQTEHKIVAKAAGWQCWGNKLKDGNPPSAPAGDGGNSGGEGGHEEIIYAQPNPQAGSTMTSITNPSAILKAYPKPLSKGEIINWLKEGEIHRAGLLLNYAQSHHHASPVMGHQTTGNNLTPVLVTWFFGLISRQQAEKYLHGQPAGTFLVRISTRIWGYTLSYQASSGRTKHFLISAINPAVRATLETGPVQASLPPQTGKQQRMSPFLPQGRYAFIGTNMTPYGTLVSLIRHHSHAPITKLGGEKLLNPCPGGPQVAGLEHVFQKSSQASSSTSSQSTSNLIISSCS